MIYYAFQLCLVPADHDHSTVCDRDSYDHTATPEIPDLMSRTVEVRPTWRNEAAHSSDQDEGAKGKRIGSGSARRRRPRRFLRVFRISCPGVRCGSGLAAHLAPIAGFVTSQTGGCSISPSGKTDFRSLFDLQTVNLADVLGVPPSLPKARSVEAKDF